MTFKILRTKIRFKYNNKNNFGVRNSQERVGKCNRESQRGWIKYNFFYFQKRYNFFKLRHVSLAYKMEKDLAETLAAST